MSSTGRIYTSRHVMFNEEDFIFKQGSLNLKQPKQVIIGLSSISLPSTELNTWQQDISNSSTYSSISRFNETISDSFTGSSTDSGHQYNVGIQSEENQAPESCGNVAIDITKRGYQPVSDDNQLQVVLDLPPPNISTVHGQKASQEHIM